MNIIIACRAINNMAGGVERQAIALANEMYARGHQVGLLSLDHNEAEAFYEIHPDITWNKLNIGNPKVKAGFITRVKRAFLTREIVKQNDVDVIIAFQQGMFLSMRLFTMFMKLPVIAAERESPFRYDFIKVGKWRNFIFQTFRLTKYITVQCESYIKAYPKYLQPYITAIPNPVFPATSKVDTQKRNGNMVLCVGRLSYQKNQDVLIDAFMALHNDFPQWTLVLAGEGENRAHLENKIKVQNIGSKIILKGAVKDVHKLYEQSDILCIPSKWEGFPNVLGEALAHSLPAIGYAGCGGVCDLIENNYNGILASGNGDEESFKAALKILMSDNEKRKAMEKHALESVQKYHPEVIYTQWEEYLGKVIKK